MKKIFRNIMTLMTVPFMLMTSACESMDDTNVDPTRMNTANAGSFLDPLIYGMGTYTWTRYNSWTFQLMQCLVTTNSTSGVGWFNISDTAGDGVWTNYYKWNTNAKAIYDEAVKVGDPNYQAIALTLRCWIFENTTDAFGDIPVQESCRGEEQLYYPKFESQTDVYRFIIDSLDVANSIYNLKKGLQFNTNGDKMYCSSGSDLQGILKWKKFTNSLRLRALLRVIDSKELGDLAKAELAQRGLISDDAKLLYEKAVAQLLRNGELRFLTGILITGRQHMMERFAASWNRSSMHSSSLISSNGLSIIVPVILMYRKVQV